jgi:hypothetical protein
MMTASATAPPTSCASPIPPTRPPSAVVHRSLPTTRPSAPRRSPRRDHRLRQPAPLRLSRSPQAPRRHLVPLHGIEVPAPRRDSRLALPPNAARRGALSRPPRRFEPADATNGAFAQFADAKTLVERNAYFVSRDVRAGPARRPALLPPVRPVVAMALHDRDPHRRQPRWSTTPAKITAGPGELRRVLLSELLDHPQPQWRPVAGNPNFLGVYRWNILRGTP